MQFDRQTLISATSNKSIHYIESSSNTYSVPYLQYDVMQFYSPKNTVSRVLGFACYWDHCEGNAQTTKSVIISLVENGAAAGGANGIVESTIINAYDNKDFTLVHGMPINAYSYEPSDLAAFEAHLQRMVFDDVRCLQIAFYNNTGYTTSARRFVKMFVEREVVAR